MRALTISFIFLCVGCGNSGSSEAPDPPQYFEPQAYGTAAEPPASQPEPGVPWIVSADQFSWAPQGAKWVHFHLVAESDDVGTRQQRLSAHGDYHYRIHFTHEFLDRCESPAAVEIRHKAKEHGLAGSQGRVFYGVGAALIENGTLHMFEIGGRDPVSYLADSTHSFAFQWNRTSIEFHLPTTPHAAAAPLVAKIAEQYWQLYEDLLAGGETVAGRW